MSAHLPLTLPLGSNQLLEASAGTGKTYTITNLCLRLLLGRDVPWQRPLAISEILILTFTIAATDELKDRVLRRINQARDAYRQGTDDAFLNALIDSASDPEKELKLLSAASQLMDDASIFTIHGFAARVLAEQAFESGTLFNQDLNAERGDLLNTAAQDCFRKMILPLPEELRGIALGLWPNPVTLAKKLSPLLFRGELAYLPLENPQITSGSIVSKIEQVKAAWLSEDMKSFLEKAGVNKQRKAFKHLNFMQQLCESDVINLGSELWQTYSAESIAVSLKKGFDYEPHPTIELISEICADSAQIEVNLWHQVISYINASMSLQKTARAQMTLDDLLTSLSSAISRTGSKLATTVARRWPVALIDEFQDTDAVQSKIFSAIYPSTQRVGAGSQDPGTVTAGSLLMIGDPKQAIYNFRGADIYTYINARRTASGKHSLSTNWRSSHDMVAATNWLFDKHGIFGKNEDIQFSPVDAAAPHAAMSITKNGHDCAPYEISIAPDAKGAGGVNAVRRTLMAHAANETVALINGDHQTRIDDKPVHAGQIAFLVRRRVDAIAAQSALAERGIQSVYLTLDSVFLQDTASDLKLVLQAILEPGNDRAIRAALATQLLQTSAEEIDQLSFDIHYQQQVFLEFQNYHLLWRDQNIAAMLDRLVKSRCLAEKWLHQPGGERQLTNLRHLAEVLQHRALASPGMYQLIKWFGVQQREAETMSDEQRQLRLESDQNLVKIVTMHAAKGLEYDIVMLPIPIFPDMTKKKDPALFHQETNGYFSAAVELGQNADHRLSASAEEKEEEMRLLYVALTRARYRCYLGLPATKSLPTAGIARLLNITADDIESLIPALQARLDPDKFEVVPANDARGDRIASALTTRSLTAPPPRPRVFDQWRVHSYTSLSARLTAGHPKSGTQIRGFEDDDAINRHPVSPSRTDQNDGTTILSRHEFPRGARIGVALHSLMEHIDFTDVSQHVLPVEKLLKRLGLAEEWAPIMYPWLEDILGARLGSHRLADIRQEDRMDEMEFHFPVSASPELTTALERLGYRQDSNTSKITLEGMMTGMIDLTFRVNNRYYIVDYKSNHLGPDSSAYAPEQLALAMDEHQYHLQYLIYSVALHRLLQRRIPEYDYEQHFGGVYYLFVRGAITNSTNGVFSARPDEAMIREIDLVLGGDG